jgi:hypothetical protein
MLNLLRAVAEPSRLPNAALAYPGELDRSVILLHGRTQPPAAPLVMFLSPSSVTRERPIYHERCAPGPFLLRQAWQSLPIENVAPSPLPTRRAQDEAIEVEADRVARLAQAAPASHRRPQRELRSPPRIRPRAEPPRHGELRARRAPGGIRRLFPRAGVKRTVRFGDFKQQLLKQLAHPERLRDSHCLPCCVQLYELTSALSIEEVACKVFGRGQDTEQLLLLTAAKAQRLRLPPPGRNPSSEEEDLSDVRRPLPAGSRVLHLHVLHDHTQAAQPPAWPSRPSQPSTRAVPRKIPERFLQPWEFRLTREEALYDMTAAARSSGLFASIGRCLWRIVRRAEFRRWRALLTGNADEQLWAVRPPGGSLSDPVVRDWAARTLALAGYADDWMLREWELYWRRKGV